MEKKFKFSENPTASKIVYTVVIAILAVSAIVVGIISASSRKDTTPPDNSGNIVETPGENDDGNQNQGAGNETESPKPTVFVAPTVGTVAKMHSLDTPVFSVTLGSWRVHTGIDISTAEGAEVFSAADGEVSAIYEDPLFGLTVEVSHSNNIKTVYSNLAKDGSIAVAVGDAVSLGDMIGHVGDSAISELADEAHLHFEIKVNDTSVNPLDYLSEESKKASLGLDA